MATYSTNGDGSEQTKAHFIVAYLRAIGQMFYISSDFVGGDANYYAKPASYLDPIARNMGVGMKAYIYGTDREDIAIPYYATARQHLLSRIPFFRRYAKLSYHHVNVMALLPLLSDKIPPRSGNRISFQVTADTGAKRSIQWVAMPSDREIHEALNEELSRLDVMVGGHAAMVAKVLARLFNTHPKVILGEAYADDE